MFLKCLLWPCCCPGNSLCHLVTHSLGYFPLGLLPALGAQSPSKTGWAHSDTPAPDHCGGLEEGVMLLPGPERVENSKPASTASLPGPLPVLPIPTHLRRGWKWSGLQVVVLSVTHSTGKHPEWKLEVAWHGRIEIELPAYFWILGWGPRKGR